MATRIPDPLKRRLVIENEHDERRALALAEAYLSEGRMLEALIFLRRAKAHERLEELLEEGVAQGDAFLVREAAAALEREVGGATWRRVAEAASELGKDAYAAEASRQAERFQE